MFEGSLVESTALLQSRNRWPALLSVAVQAVAALVLIAVPMLHPELLPMHAPALLLAPPPVPHAPPPPPPIQHVRAELSNATAPSMPASQPAHTALIRTALLPTVDTVDTPVSVYTGPRMGGNSLPAGLGIPTATTPPFVSVTPAPAAHVGPVKVSSGVTQGLLIAPIRPEYPAIARTTRTEGTVVVRAIISRTGQIERAEVQSGPIMLHEAALRAVEQARYRPFLLSGQPTEVDTTITIVFRMGG